MSEDDNLENIKCISCGISFGLDKVVFELWKQSHKLFYCPNGHGLAWPDKTESEKELQDLRSKVKSLEEQLATTTANLATQTKLVDDLQAELEIWRPNERK